MPQLELTTAFLGAELTFQACKTLGWDAVVAVHHATPLLLCGKQSYLHFAMNTL